MCAAFAAGGAHGGRWYRWWSGPQVRTGSCRGSAARLTSGLGPGGLGPGGRNGHGWVSRGAWGRDISSCRVWPRRAFRVAPVGASLARSWVANMDGIFEGGIKGFLFKGTNGRWRDVLDADDLAVYQAQVDRLLPPDAAAWMVRGRAAFGGS